MLSTEQSNNKTSDIKLVSLYSTSSHLFSPSPLQFPSRVSAICYSAPLMSTFSYCGGPDSSVGIATGYGLDGSVIESRRGARYSAPVQTGPRAHPASCTMGTGSFPGAKSVRKVTLNPQTGPRAHLASCTMGTRSFPG